MTASGKNIGVFCGSNHGLNAHFTDAAQVVGTYIADHGDTLVYGGGSKGLMGTVAAAAAERNGKIIGVMPRFLIQRGISDQNISEFIETKTMDERKTKMMQLCDAFIVLPGGFGTLEEFNSLLSWSQMDLHQAPIVLYNVDHFFDPMVAMLENSYDAGFAPAENRQLYLSSDSLAEIVTFFDQFAHTLPNKYTN
ncbi:Rossman fold protein, TIGR00730 family [Secundilactobacillus paracollinoides]|uniref:LOG family protein n=1 Tax=Secundilactobacillus paracollinoides TaxID=240427 RepID=UPI00081A3DB5|nr:TIGR00730 family Rossman fold protein [Secundilactobacillus paracollinoides]ANZ64068.1 Rossman fold protein, TIGR00730 family [Secundilactobacillus paracollinoides]